MTGNFNSLLHAHDGKPALYDSNLFLLYLAATFDPSLISSFKRLNSFVPEDVALVAALSRRFSSISTTPHVLTEVGNLLNHLPLSAKTRMLPWFGSQIAQFEEVFVEARVLGKLRSFHQFGITDSCLAHLAEKYVIVSIDFPLVGFIQSQGLSAINFTNLRASWLLP